MIGIESIAVEIPKHRIETVSIANAVGPYEGAEQAAPGFTHLTRKGPGQEASDMCVAAADRLFSTKHVARAEIECVIVVTQNPDGYGIPHVAAILQAKLALGAGCSGFDVGLGGSGYVYGLAIAKSFMEAQQLKRGLLFTCDPYSRVLGDLDSPGARSFGDAATVTLLSDKPRWTIGRFDLGTDGSQGDALQVRLRLGGRLHMDAEALSQFATSRGARSLKSALKLNELTLAQIDRILVQQGSRAIVEGIANALAAQGKLKFHAEGYGDTVSSSIPTGLALHMASTDRHIAVFGYGAGLSWGSTVITKVA